MNLTRTYRILDWRLTSWKPTASILARKVFQRFGCVPDGKINADERQK
ncbi:MAG: hypothetical protein ACLSFT_00335 [Ruminococcus callidus]